MNFRAYILAAIFAVGGIAVLQRPLTFKNRPTEAWLEKQVPTSFGKFTEQSTYKMDTQTYQILNPYGIVSRIMSDGAHAYDAVFIASDSSLSFHDPLECFAGQSNEILSQSIMFAPTKSYGNVPVTVLLMKNDKIGAIIVAAYCFKTPDGIKASPDDIHFSMFKHEILSGKPQQGGFYRVIDDFPGSDDQTQKATLSFMGQYIDAIHDRDPKDF